MVEEKEDIEEIGHLNVLVRACERRRGTKTKVMMLFVCLCSLCYVCRSVRLCSLCYVFSLKTNFVLAVQMFLVYMYEVLLYAFMNKNKF